MSLKDKRDLEAQRALVTEAPTKATQDVKRKDPKPLPKKKDKAQKDDSSQEVQNLRYRNSDLQRENKTLKDASQNSTTVKLVNGELLQERSLLTPDGWAKQSKAHQIGQGYKTLAPVLKPLIRVISGISNGKNVDNYIKRRPMTNKQMDPSAENGGDQFVLEGVKVMNPSPLDKARAVSEIIYADEDCRKAIEFVSEYIKSRSTEIEDKAKQIANPKLTSKDINLTTFLQNKVLPNSVPEGKSDDGMEDSPEL